MKNKKIIILVSVILVVIVPIFINLSFKVYLAPLFTAEWGAGDLLSYYGSLLGGIITLVGVVMTLNYQTKQSEADDAIKYKPILKLSAVDVEYIGFMGRREVKIMFPFYAFNHDEYKIQKEKLFYRQMEDTSDFHLIFENKGRGEAVEVSLDSVGIREVDWDEDSHLYIGASVPMSLGEILVNEKADIIISLPNYLFLKTGREYYSIRIDLVVSYNDMFHRNKKTMKILSDFQIIPVNKATAPYIYKEEFEYYEVEVRYMGSQQLE